MKLLIITQKVNKQDFALGFFHEWIRVFALECESVEVVALEVGQYDLPQNVTVNALKGFHGKSIINRIYSRIQTLCRFYYLMFKLRDRYDHVFVHMNPIYIVLFGIFWRLQKKKISLWYVHKAVDLKLRIATIFANIIFSSTKDSFRIKTDKVRYVGHGIDTNLFHCENIFETHASHIVILHVGRITQIKDISTLIKAVDQIKKTGKSVEVKLIGDPVYEKDKMYLNELKAEIKSLDLEREFHFLGGMPQDKIIAHMCSSHIMVNMTPTGGMDKAVIEAMSCGRPVVTSNEAFREVFGNMAEKLIFRYGDSVDLKNKIMEISRLDKTTMPDELRWIATHNFSINELVYKICEILKS